MSSKLIVGIRVLLLIILVLSIFQLWSLWHEFSSKEKVVAAIDIDRLNEKFKEIEAVKSDYSLTLKEDWKTIVENDFFNLKEKPSKMNQNIQSKKSIAVSKNKKKKKVKLDPPFSLLAISKKGTESRLVIADKSNHKTYILKVDEEINGYQVKEIKKSEVILSYQGENITLSFSK